MVRVDAAYLGEVRGRIGIPPFDERVKAAWCGELGQSEPCFTRFL